MVLLVFGCFSLAFLMAFRASGVSPKGLQSILGSDTVITANQQAVPASLLPSQLEGPEMNPGSLAINNEAPADLIVNGGTNSSTSYSAFKLHPMAVSYVRDYQEENEERLQKMKSTSVAQFNMIDKILTGYSLPKELKYLAVIESDLSSNAVSWAGAVGPWQLMAPTGKLLGLKINRYHDERKNLYKSTNAAAKYLRDLYDEFNDWLLVIAAYNSGSAKVESAIRRSRSRNFWKLQYYLPAESRNHVKKFIATHYIMEGQGGITTTVTADIGSMKLNKLTEEELTNTRVQLVTGKYKSTVVARKLGMDLAQFNRLNPDFDKHYWSSAVLGHRCPCREFGVCLHRAR